MERRPQAVLIIGIGRIRKRRVIAEVRDAAQMIGVEEVPRRRA